jgi:hypothetical protein
MTTGTPPMSTSINNLPETPVSTMKTVEEDPMITDVINEMERDYMVQTAPPPQPMYIPPPPPPQIHQHYQPKFAPQQVQIDNGFVAKLKSIGINKDQLQLAFLASAIAYLVFYPIETDFIYQKIEKLSVLAPYDRVIRALLLALLFYVIFWKLNIRF